MNECLLQITCHAATHTRLVMLSHKSEGSNEIAFGSRKTEKKVFFFLDHPTDNKTRENEKKKGTKHSFNLIPANGICIAATLILDAAPCTGNL